MIRSIPHSVRLTCTAVIGLLCSMAALAHDHVEGPIPYRSGGVGEGGRAAIEAVQDQYSLKLVFAYTNGEFLAEVKVVITDAADNTLVATDTDGPWLLVALPAGRYRVAATVNGETKTESVTVPARGLKTVNMQWPPAS